jgi:hypothetical protein
MSVLVIVLVIVIFVSLFKTTQMKKVTTRRNRNKNDFFIVLIGVNASNNGLVKLAAFCPCKKADSFTKYAALTC